MRHFVSQWQAFFYESEQEAADRMHFSYGLQRAAGVAEIYGGHLTAPPLRAFWFRVGYLLSQHRNDLGPLPKEHEGYKKADESPAPPAVMVRTPEGPSKVTLAEFRAAAKRIERERKAVERATREAHKEAALTERCRSVQEWKAARAQALADQREYRERIRAIQRARGIARGNR